MKDFFNKVLYKLYKTLILKNKIKSTKHKVFLIGTPEHGNLGDQKIAVSQVQFLKSLGIDFLEVPDSMYPVFKNNIKDSTENLILLHGGGNLGNEYERCQNIRNDCIKSYPLSKIVVMPQTIYFSNDEIGSKKLKETVEIFAEHKNLTICAREQVSYDKMKECFAKNNIVFVPDIVLSNNVKEKSKGIKKQVLFLLRDDVEKVDNLRQIKEIEEWAKKNNYVIKYNDTNKEYRVSMLNRDRELKKLFKLIEDSEFVVTDRLHGMIFSYIADTPVVVFKNYNHKITSSYDWIKDGKVALYNEGFDINEFLKIKSTSNKNLEDKFEDLKKIIKD